MQITTAVALTTLLALSRSSVHVEQDIQSSSKVKSSIHVENKVEDGVSEISIEITGVPEPLITIIEEENRADVHVETHQVSKDETDSNINVEVGLQTEPQLDLVKENHKEINEKMQVMMKERSLLGGLRGAIDRIVNHLLGLVFTLLGADFP